MSTDRRGQVRIARNVWVPADAVDDLTSTCHFVLAGCADDAVIGYDTAARLHRLWLPAWLESPAIVHVVTATPGRQSRGMTRTKRPELRAHRRSLSEVDRTVVDGVPVTSVARTWIDLAAVLPPADLAAAGDRALQLTTPDALLDVLTRSVHLRGVRRARAVFPLLDARSRSRPESHLRFALAGSDLPPFAVNEAVHRRDGGWLAEPDLSLPEARIALEYQGSDHAEVGRMRRDITRLADLRFEDWECMLFGPAEVFGRPWLIAPQVRRLVAQRAPHLLPPSPHR